jgi:hypothetical protein
MKAIILRALAAGAVAAGVSAAGVAHADPDDDATYGRLAADAHAQGIPGGTTQLGTLAEATCALASGSMRQSDVDATLRDGAPAAWSLLQSWTKAQTHAFGALVIADGYCGSTLGGAR